jgi:hypothetical protein
VSKTLQYPVPWDVISKLGPHILRGTRSEVQTIYRGFVSRMQPPPLFEGLDQLPQTTRFVLAANHYQRPGLWIAHIASVLACAMDDRYHAAPPLRWLVTANWPRWKLGTLSVRSPGDILLPKVAHAAWCYAVPFAGTNPGMAGRSLRRLLKDTADAQCPIGIFPEGAQATAGKLSPPLPGIGRLFTMLAERGWHVQPAGVSEAGRFVVRFGPPIETAAILEARDAGALILGRIADLL